MNQSENKIHVLQTIAPREKQIKTNGNAIIEFEQGHLYLICNAPAQKQQISADLIRKTIESFKEYFEDQEYPDLQKALLNAVIYANKKLLADALGNDGVSLAVALVSDQLLYYVGVGDCQIVLIQKGKLKPLTISHENFERSNFSAESDFLGLKREIKVSVSAHPVALRKKDIILIANGSFYQKISQNNLSEILINPNTHLNHKALDISELAASSDDISQATYFLLQIGKYINSEKAPSFFNRYIVTSLLLAAIFITAVYVSDKFFNENQSEVKSILEKELQESEDADSNNFIDTEPDLSSNQVLDAPVTTVLQNNNELKFVLRDTIIYHQVQKGETLYRIALRYHISVGEIEMVNKTKASAIQLGQKIRIPVKGLFTPAQQTNLEKLSKISGVPLELLLKANATIDEKENVMGKCIIFPK